MYEKTQNEHCKRTTTLVNVNLVTFHRCCIVTLVKAGDISQNLVKHIKQRCEVGNDKM